MLAGDRFFGIHTWTFFDLFFGKRYPEVTLNPIRAVYGNGRDQDVSSQQPRPGINHQIANYPTVVTEVQVLNMADMAISCADGIVFQFFLSALIEF